MRHLLTILFFGITINVFGQDLETLEWDIRHSYGRKLKKVQKIADKIYHLDPYNETATSYLVMSYNYNQHLDLIPILFAKLKSINANSPIPYLLSAKYQFQNFSLSDTPRIAELKSAIKLDSNNFEAHYFLGKSYYTLFNKKQTDYYAYQSREQLIKATQLDKSLFASLKYPIIQTSNFLNDKDFISALESKVLEPTTDSLNIPTNSNWYFPLNSFLGLGNNWQSDYSADLIHQVSKVTYFLERYSKHLSALKEPLVFNQTEKTIYRFTWLRTFHKPVAIRLEKTNKSYTLYWKETSGAGGYDPGSLIVNSSKPLTKDQWDKFISLLQSTDFWNMTTNANVENIADGSKWIIEGIENGKYHVVDRTSPKNNNFQTCGKYLIELTNLKVKTNDFY